MEASSNENQVYETIREILIKEKSYYAKRKQELEDSIQRLKHTLHQHRETLVDNDKKRNRDEDLLHEDTAKRRKLEQENGRNEVKSRMMGFLLNTLQKSKQELKGNESALKKKEEIEKKISEKEQSERRATAQKEIQTLETQIKEKEKRLDQLLPIYEITVEAVQKFWDQEYEILSYNRIKSKAKHNETTSKKLVEEQQHLAASKRLEFEQFIRQNKIHFEACIKELENLSSDSY